jgi:outer membrane protein OmpA-like peptidoglycan-associated protein
MPLPVPSAVRSPSLVLRACTIVGLAIGASCAPRTKPPDPVPVNAPARKLPDMNREAVSEFARRGIDAREAEEGLVIYLPTVYLFAFDSFNVGAEARKQIKQIAELLNDRFLVGRRIIVEGHTDAIGSQTYNLALSEKRADSVIAELVAAGVDKGRLTKRAFGKQRPLEPNKRSDGTDNPEGRAKNRRVALIVQNPKR